MKHLATIQTEFIKEARRWDRMSREDQKAYLKRHPKSKRKLTGKSIEGMPIFDKNNKEIPLKKLLKEKRTKIKKNEPATKFEVGQKVNLKANKEEGWPAEEGTITSIDDIDNDVIMVKVDKKYRDGKDDDGLREVGVDQIESEDIDDFIMDFSNKYNSAAEIWMSDEKKEELQKMVKSDKFKFKSDIKDASAANFDDDVDVTRYIEKRKEKGWLLFDSDDNNEQQEYIFYKKK